MSNIVINTERFDDLIAKKRDEIEKIEIFKASKIDIINSQLFLTIRNIHVMYLHIRTIWLQKFFKI